MKTQKRISVIDSHTGGEPTRVIIDGTPKLEGQSAKERLEYFRENHDNYRTAVACEPRGYQHLVGALLCEPIDRSCIAGVIFFNTESYLGMCGHGTIGLITTLAHMGRIQSGEHRIETPVGIVSTYLHDSGEITVANVPAYRTQHQVRVNVPDYAPVTGDVAWGGNWFFLVEDHNMILDMQHIDMLTEYTWQIRMALREQGVTGDDGQEIDHVELFAESQLADSKNFVLCPGKVYDRSPCGTGTSAKMACLYADGKLEVGQIWTQESIIGSVFKGSIKIDNDLILPSITGRAYIMAEATLILDQADPFYEGVPR